MKWITTTIYIDVETGEILTWKKDKEKYYQISIHKEKTIISENRKYGYVTWTAKCRRRPTQTDLYENNNE